MPNGQGLCTRTLPGCWVGRRAQHKLGQKWFPGQPAPAKLSKRKRKDATRNSDDERAVCPSKTPVPQGVAPSRRPCAHLPHVLPTQPAPMWTHSSLSPASLVPRWDRPQDTPVTPPLKARHILHFLSENSLTKATSGRRLTVYRSFYKSLWVSQ